jgi:signal peptidase II
VKRNLLIVSIIVVVLLALDQFIKIYIKSTFVPGETHGILGDWFILEYIENQGMAFGTRFGSSIWGKLSLSIFRIVAIGGIIYYMTKQFKKGVRLEFLIALGLILTGATGNLIDSMFYDFVFPVDQYLDCTQHYNQLPGSGNISTCNYYGFEQEVELRHTGFLFGNVVDMFKFQV